MPWVRLEDTFPEHPKLADVGGDAGWLHVCAIAYCSRNLTDGFVPAGAVRQLSDRAKPSQLAASLVQAGLWEPTERGYMIHDYLDYQPTRAEVEAERAERSAKKAAAGRLGGIASGVARRKHGRSTDEANGEAEANENEAPTRPDPTRPSSEYVRDNSTSENTGEAGDISRRDEALNAYADLAIEQAEGRGTDIGSYDGYRKKARKTAAAHPDLYRWLEMFPTAPATAVAFWLMGDKHSMHQYPRADELATVHHLREATA